MDSMIEDLGDAFDGFLVWALLWGKVQGRDISLAEGGAMVW